MPKNKFGDKRPGDKLPSVIFESGSSVCCIDGDCSLSMAVGDIAKN